MKRARVERVIADHGYGFGWVVLAHDGCEVHWAPEWHQALWFATRYVVAVSS